MVWRWSKTAATNATADSSINWAEGMAPSAVNDSARAEMARVAQWRDDISGGLTTSGTSTAYTVSSNQVFDTFAHMDGAMIAFVPHATNTSGGGTTLNVDGLGARALRLRPGVELVDGHLILGTPYVVTYVNADNSFYLQGGGYNPYSIPLAGGLDYWGTAAPNSAFAFPAGQAISRTTYASLYALVGNTYGAGDGSTTFNLPDKRGRISAAKDNMLGSTAGRLTGAYFGAATGGASGVTLGAVGGSEGFTLANNQLPTTTLAFSGIPQTWGSSTADYWKAGSIGSYLLGSGGTGIIAYNNGSGVTQGNISTTVTPAGSISAFGADQPHPNVQPSIICNYIIRVI